jgi:HEPN domain-containing protein
MLDISKQVAHWRQLAEEDWAVAVDLVGDGRTRHGLFFAHLALEKLLKALVCRHTQEMAPKIHSLVRLAELAGLQPSPEQRDVLAEMNAFHLEGRYPEALTPEPALEEAQAYVARAEEVLRWLTSQF